MKGSRVYDCTMIELDKHHHEKGNITVVENGRTVPFDVRRTYYLYDVPGGESRGGHAHRALRQLIVAASGSFDVTVDDGSGVKRTFTLNRPYQGLLVVPGIWRELNNFSSGSVCLVLASHEYDEGDYIRNYDEFLEYKREMMGIMIHPLADVHSDTQIGEETNVWQYCVVMPGVVIGRKCNICAHVLIENDVHIGDEVTVKSGVQLWKGVKLEDKVFIGPNVTFTNDLVPRSKANDKGFESTLIEEGASIGANATIVAGHTIGKYALVGAGSVVTCDIPANTVWYGNPARHRGYVTNDGILLDMNKRDKAGKQYTL